EALEKFSARRMLRGVRHVLHDEEDDRYMLRDDFLRGISKLAQYDLTYDILIFPRHIRYAVELVHRFPQQRFIVDHIAKPLIKKGEIRSWKHDMEVLAKAENVFCKMSGMVTEGSWDGWRESDFVPYMESVVEMFGAERVAFGSDWPVCTVAASYQEVVGIVENYISSFSVDEQAKIMGVNAVRFYGLDL
ncbi:MAG: amidohydrolase family protein, partial [Planctomycetota bacterium]